MIRQIADDDDDANWIRTMTVSATLRGKRERTKSEMTDWLNIKKQFVPLFRSFNKKEREKTKKYLAINLILAIGKRPTFPAESEG